VVLPGDDTISVVAATPDRVVLADAAVEWAFDVARDGSDVYVDSPLGQVALSVVPRFTEPGSAVAHGSLVAPMPGLVIRVGAGIGDTVVAAQPLIWLEAMKMEHTITAPTAGVLTALNVKAGEQVEVGAVLAHIEQEPAADGGQE
jgi:biotin carboxyl carrier protein